MGRDLAAFAGWLAALGLCALAIPWAVLLAAWNVSTLLGASAAARTGHWSELVAVPVTLAADVLAATMIAASVGATRFFADLGEGWDDRRTGRLVWMLALGAALWMPAMLRAARLPFEAEPFWWSALALSAPLFAVTLLALHLCRTKVLA